MRAVGLGQTFPPVWRDFRHVVGTFRGAKFIDLDVLSS